MFTSTFKLSYQPAGQYIVRFMAIQYRLILAVSQVQLFFMQCTCRIITPCVCGTSERTRKTIIRKWNLQKTCSKKQVQLTSLIIHVASCVDD